MTLSDLEWLSKIFNDTKRRAVSLRQLSFLFSPAGRPAVLGFPDQTLWQYSDGDPPTGAKHRDFRPSSDFGIDDWWSVECRQQFRPWNKFISQSVGIIYSSRRHVETQLISESSHEPYSAVNKLLWSKYVYDNKDRRRFYQSTGTPERTKQNLIVRSGKSEAEVTNN